ncbi:MAG: hypothetical protein AMXMBFR57_22870 [Acidimicrobiia bacterium]
MSTVALVRRQLLRELDAFIREVEACPDDEVLWKVAPGVTNSVGNLGLHVAGNLQHFVGHMIGGSGYVRDREREFSQRSGTRAEVCNHLRAAREVVDATLAALPDSRLSDELTGVLPDRGLPIGPFLMHLGAHLAFHLGQAGYLRRVLTGDNTSLSPLPIKEMLTAG